MDEHLQRSWLCLGIALKWQLLTGKCSFSIRRGYKRECFVRGYNTFYLVERYLVLLDELEERSEVIIIFIQNLPLN